MKLLSLSGDLFGEGYDRPYEFALACENEVYIEYLSKKMSMESQEVIHQTLRSYQIILEQIPVLPII